MAEPYERNRLPTLFEVLNLRTRAPVDLWSFYVFMREQYRGVEYLDFWLDVVKHLSLCREYVKGIRQSQLTSSSRESSVLLDNLMQDGILDDSDSRRLSAFLRGEDQENNPGFSRLSALLDTVHPKDQQRPLTSQQQHSQDVLVRSPNVNNAALQQPPHNLQQPQVAEPVERVPSTTNERPSSSIPALVTSQSGSLQPPNTSAVAAAWAQAKRRTSGSPIRVGMSDGGRDPSSRPTSTARDFRSSSVYDDQDLASPTSSFYPSRDPFRASSGTGVSISAPVAAVVTPQTPSLNVSTPGLMSPITNRPNVSSSLYNQGLSATPQLPHGETTMTSSGSYYSSGPADTSLGVPATAASFNNNNNNNNIQHDLEKQQQFDHNNLLLQQEHLKHHHDNKNGAPNPKNNILSTSRYDDLTNANQLSKIPSHRNDDSPALSFVSRSDIKQSTHYILVTYFIPGAEREIVLPQRIMKSVRKAIEEDGRDDPEVFDEAREYVFQALQQEAFRAFLAAKALGNTTPFGSVVRLIIGLLSAFAAFWVGFILIFLDWQPKSYRLFLIIPFAFASYGIISGLYNLDPILALLGYSETGPGKMIRIREPYVRSLLIKRALFVTALIILIAACFIIVFALVPGRRL